MATDRELIEKVRHGESEVYGQLFQKYYGQIYAICLAMLKNPQDAEELAQDVFILAYVRLDQLREPGKFFPWLKKIARNRSKNHIQKAGPRLVPLRSASARKAPDAPDEHVLRQELMDAIMEAIQALPAKDREVVQARIDGLSYKEISEHSGISVQASMNRLSRARRRLADRMKGLLSAIFSLPKILSPQKIISGGITAAKAGTAAKVTIGVVGILVAGFIGLQLGTRLTDTHPSEIGVSPSETAISQHPSSITETIRKPIQEVGIQPSVNEQNFESEEDINIQEIQELLAWLDSLEADTVEIHPNLAKSAHNILPEESQSHPEMYYDKIYKTFLGITKKIILVKEEMAPIDEELEQLVGEWKCIVRDPENLTEEEERLTLEMKEDSRPMWEELQELERGLNSLVNELINNIEAAVPGAIQIESKDTPKGTVDYVRIDYEHIRSALRSLPEETHAYLAEFFAGFAHISR